MKFKAIVKANLSADDSKVIDLIRKKDVLFIAIKEVEGSTVTFEISNTFYLKDEQVGGCFYE